MREILFRGQTRRKGAFVCMDGTSIESNWVYGGIFPNNNGGDFAIIYQQEPEIKKFPVYSDTVGQYTGLTDKNGKKIFEGDICDMVYDGNMKTYVIVWDEEEQDFKGTNGKKEYGTNFQYMGCCEELVVVGNIFDNPELLKEGE